MARANNLSGYKVKYNSVASWGYRGSLNNNILLLLIYIILDFMHIESAANM